jgi:DNA-binding NarL/FixJ family response regulator
VSKKAAGSELLQAIRGALRGESHITRQIAQGIEDSFIRNPRGRSQPRSLTRRQREVIQLLAEGKTMKEAAGVLNLTKRTIGFHKYKVMEELGLKTNADLFQFAVRHRILVDGQPSANQL